MFAPPPEGQLFLFDGKFLGSLNPFSQNGFKWVWAKPTTLSPHLFSTIQDCDLKIEFEGT